jgi:hypothetical protein
MIELTVDVRNVNAYDLIRMVLGSHLLRTHDG